MSVSEACYESSCHVTIFWIYRRNMCVHIYVCMYVCMYECSMYVYMYVCMNVKSHFLFFIALYFDVPCNPVLMNGINLTSASRWT